MAVSSHGKQARGGLPRGPHTLTSEQVVGDQRRRLVAAMVELAGKSGYAAATVADIIDRAQVSRKTFYAHFDERRTLLLAAFDTVAPSAFEEVQAASQRTGGPTRQLEALMRALCRVARESPGTIALSTIEIAAANPAGVERREHLMGDYGLLIDQCLNADSHHTEMPLVLARTLAGGTHRAIDASLREGRTEQLPALAPQLARWTRSYHPVPADLSASTTTPTPECQAARQLGLVGGRAPGTLTLAPNGYQPPAGRRSAGYVHHANRERILDAVAQLNYAHGYTSLAARSLAERADVSERAFLAHFKSMDDAFATAVEVGHMKGQAIVDRARADAPDWGTGVRRAVCALLEFLACEPYFTRLAFVDAPLAGPAMARRTYEHAGAYARLLLDGAPQRRRPPRLAPEAALHSLFELVFHHSAQSKVEDLLNLIPVASYLALAPFLGVSDAASEAV